MVSCWLSTLLAECPASWSQEESIPTLGSQHQSRFWQRTTVLQEIRSREETHGDAFSTSCHGFCLVRELRRSERSGCSWMRHTNWAVTSPGTWNYLYVKQGCRSQLSYPSSSPESCQKTSKITAGHLPRSAHPPGCLILVSHKPLHICEFPGGARSGSDKLEQLGTQDEFQGMCMYVLVSVAATPGPRPEMHRQIGLGSNKGQRPAPLAVELCRLYDAPGMARRRSR